MRIDFFMHLDEVILFENTNTHIISLVKLHSKMDMNMRVFLRVPIKLLNNIEKIGRASCRERV